MRLLHLLVIGVLVFAAAYVYRIKIARNGPGLTRRCGCRVWPNAICRSSRLTPHNMIR
jgi:hypothetical protein